MAKAYDLTLSVQKSIALPDVHSGYGFAIGNVAAFDMSDPEAVVSPGGVGFDINCGVRLLRTNLVKILQKCHGQSMVLHARYTVQILRDLSSYSCIFLMHCFQGLHHAYDS